MLLLFSWRTQLSSSPVRSFIHVSQISPSEIILKTQWITCRIFPTKQWQIVHIEYLTKRTLKCSCDIIVIWGLKLSFKKKKITHCGKKKKKKQCEKRLMYLFRILITLVLYDQIYFKNIFNSYFNCIFAWVKLSLSEKIT